jgi:lysophospholipase L1-like esterase
MLFKKLGSAVFLIAFFLLSFVPTGAAQGRIDWQPDSAIRVRYMAMGDSLAAGQGALPATQGYVYLLYFSGVFGNAFETVLNNAGISGATSRDVLDHQIPQAITAFEPTVITLSVGGNDLLSVLRGADLAEVLLRFQLNLTEVLLRLRLELPNTRLYLSNLYSIPGFSASEEVVPIFNLIVAGVAGQFGVPVADVYSAFSGKQGMVQPLGIHPTNKGYRAMAGAFVEVIRQHP